VALDGNGRTCSACGEIQVIDSLLVASWHHEAPTNHHQTQPSATSTTGSTEKSREEANTGSGFRGYECRHLATNLCDVSFENCSARD
jgi:hypothetical protein